MWHLLPIGVLCWMLFSTGAKGQSHTYTNQMRSGDLRYVFFQQSVDGEMGTQKMKVETEADGVKLEKPKIESRTWRGFGISSAIGMEILRFLHFQVGHTFVNLNGQDDGFSSLSGSRVFAGGRAIFTAPISNLELGAGVLGSRMDFRRQSEATSLYGSGSYASFGLNYFVSTRVSIFGEGRAMQEHLVRSGGARIEAPIDTRSTSLSLGFRIWM